MKIAKIITEIWLWFGLICYWFFWIGSVEIFGVSIGFGIIIGILSSIGHIIIFQILLLLTKQGWMWK